MRAQRRLGWRLSLPVTNLKGLVTSSSPFSLSDMIAGDMVEWRVVMRRQWLGGRVEGVSEVVRMAMG